jgi:hypothetical protein
MTDHDDTDRVLEAIDSAVADYSVSADAMRSIPAGQPRPDLRVRLGPTEGAEDLTRFFVPQIAPPSPATIAALADAFAPALVPIQDLVYEYDPAPAEDEEPAARWARMVNAGQPPRTGDRHAEDCPAMRPPVIERCDDDHGMGIRATFTVCEGCGPAASRDS